MTFGRQSHHKSNGPIGSPAARGPFRQTSEETYERGMSDPFDRNWSTSVSLMLYTSLGERKSCSAPAHKTDKLNQVARSLRCQAREQARMAQENRPRMPVSSETRRGFCVRIEWKTNGSCTGRLAIVHQRSQFLWSTWYIWVNLAMSLRCFTCISLPLSTFFTLPHTSSRVTVSSHNLSFMSTCRSKDAWVRSHLSVTLIGRDTLN